MKKLDIDESRVLALYEEHETAKAVAQIIGCSDETIYRVLKRRGVPRTHRHPKGHKSVRTSGCGKKYCWALISMLRTMCDMSYSEIVAFTGYHASVVNQVIIKRCPETRLVRTRKEDVDLQQVAHEYVDLGMTTYELGKKYGVCHTTISRWMRSLGIHKGKPISVPQSGNGKGAAILKERCRNRVVAKLKEEGDTLELVEYGERLTLRCKTCGHEFQKSKAGYDYRFTCPHCHEEDMRRQAEAKARKKFERHQQLEAAREWRLSVPRICKECGQPFYSEYEGAAYCSDKCNNRVRNRKAYERKKRRGDVAGSYRRRMRIKRTPATYDRTVTLAAVYDKYHGRCCSCGRKTYRTKSYSPTQATLDHVVALANNGTHTWDNVQLLCQECNSVKRDVGQMRIAI